MNEKERIAKKLAEITGKSITEFFNGTIKEEAAGDNNRTEDESEPAVYAEEVGDNTRQSASERTIPKKKEDKQITEELLEYQKLFKGSKIVNGAILNGRQMTKKEYNKYTKNLTLEEYYKHPLMYKIFRAEGQLDPNFMTFTDRFSKEK